MKIKKLYAENIYSYEKLEFEFDKFPGGTTLFLGRNLDQKTSNGAGKSSPMKALYFAIYGQDVAGANKSDVVRRGASKGYYLTLEFEDRGHEFKIERFEGRKDKSSSGKGLNFYIDGELFNAVKKDGSKGEAGIEETQKFINQKIKFTPRLFLSAVYSSQDSKNNFLIESDTNKKELLSELLDLQIYGRGHKYVKDVISEIEKKRDEKDSKIASLQEQIKTLEEEVKDLVGKKDEFTIEHKKEIHRDEQKLAEIERKLSKTKEGNRLYNLVEIEKDIQSLNEEKDKLEAELRTEQKIDLGYEKVNGAISSLNDKIKDLEKNIQGLVKENNELDAISYDEEAHNKLKEEFLSLEKKISDLELIKESLSKLEIEINNIFNQISNSNNKIKDLESEIKKLEESENCPTCQRPYEESHLEHVKNNIASLLKEKEAYIANKESLNSQKNLLEGDKKEKQESILELDSLKESLKEKNLQNQSLNLAFEKFKIKNEQKVKNLEKIESYQKDIEENKVKINSQEETRKQLDVLKKELDPIKVRFKEIGSKLTQLSKDQISAQLEEQELKQILDSKITLEKDRKDLIDSLSVNKRKKNPYTDMIIRLEKRSTEFLDKIEEIKKMITKDNEMLRYYGFWNIGFATTGIRSFITDDVIDLLNKKVQDNLNDLFDGAISVFFDPESKNAKGIVSNKISTNFYLNGKETPKESLSGGELRRAILATELALTEIAESRSGNKLNIRFLDEPFNGMDSNGQLQAFKLFARLSKDKDGFFVISHDESFQNMCSNVVYIVKKNEISRIVDKATYGKSNIDTDEPSDKIEIPAEETEGLSKQDILAEKLRQLKNKN